MRRRALFSHHHLQTFLSLESEQGNLLVAGIAAIPLTDAMLGWPLALAFLLLMGYTTYITLNILVGRVTVSPCLRVQLYILAHHE